MRTLRQTVITVFGAAVLTAIASMGAQAQTVSLAKGNTLSEDGWTATITGVSCRTGSVSCASSVLNDDELELVSSTHGISFELLSTGSSVLSVSDPSGATANATADLQFTVSIQPTSKTSTATLKSLSAAVAATSTPTANLGEITGSIDLSAGQGVNINGNTTSGTFTFAPTNAVSLSYNLSLAATPGTTLALNNLTTKAPEPATLAILAPVVFTLVKMRQSKKRRLAV